MTHRIDQLVAAEANFPADVMDTPLRLSGACARLVDAQHGVDQSIGPRQPRIQDWLLDEIELSARAADAIEAENNRGWRATRNGVPTQV